MNLRTVQPWDPEVTQNLCTHSVYGHLHRIVGTPMDAMTWYRCDLCGIQWERGRGAFYDGAANNEASSASGDQ